MVHTHFSAPPEPPPELAAATIDSSAALAICGVLLDVLAQMPRARALMREAAERYMLGDERDPKNQAAAMMAMGRLLDACDRKAA